ncbi:hypothetical protein IEO70_04775 [Bacillus sp. AGMB 02131]|uniref:Uncharacterized protein n=1 Tax=Peribacillus faecalis TaxID=2772559 RepID=A0A927CTQ1_9BACI|nr:DUF6056 family protein [Peribacillus faecalis]MBD3107673.1 hypothetical protein [Peribacillus faecalis]
MSIYLIKFKNYILLLLLFSFMFIFNFLAPMFADDYNYSFMWDKSKRIENFSDIIKSQYMHYMEWGGRTVAHTFGQTLLLADKVFQAVLNSLVYVLLIILIYWHSQKKV